jgi:predicted amidohydrolase YtcJ
MPQVRMASFKDGHCHALFAGREALGPSITNCESLAEIQSVITKYATENPEVDWIDAGAFQRELATDRFDLDLETFGGKAVVLHADDHHNLWVNTEALKRANLLQTQPTVSIGSIGLGDDGKPIGILREWEAMRLVLEEIPPLTMEQEILALEKAQERLLSLGITELQEAWIDPGMTEIYLEFAKRDLLKIRTHLALRFDPKTWRNDLTYFKKCQASVAELNHPRLRINAAKFFADGVLGSATAALNEAYESDAQNFGEPVWDFEELGHAIDASIGMGLSPHVHAIGDAAIRRTLDLLESRKAALSKLGCPPVIAHCELIADTDLQRFASIGVVANMQPLWARKDSLLTSCIHHIGERRLEDMYRMRSLVNSGGNLAFGSDWPVSDPNPLLGAYTAVYRAVEDAPSWNEAESLTMREALEAYTKGTEHQLGYDSNGESSERFDDFIILNADPLESSRENFSEIRVIETYIDGLRVWPTS